MLTRPLLERERVDVHTVSRVIFPECFLWVIPPHVFPCTVINDMFFLDVSDHQGTRSSQVSSWQCSRTLKQGSCVPGLANFGYEHF